MENAFGYQESEARLTVHCTYYQLRRCVACAASQRIVFRTNVRTFHCVFLLVSFCTYSYARAPSPRHRGGLTKSYLHRFPCFHYARAHDDVSLAQLTYSELYGQRIVCSQWIRAIASEHEQIPIEVHPCSDGWITVTLSCWFLFVQRDQRLSCPLATKSSHWVVVCQSSVSCPAVRHPQSSGTESTPRFVFSLCKLNSTVNRLFGGPIVIRTLI